MSETVEQPRTVEPVNEVIEYLHNRLLRESLPKTTLLVAIDPGVTGAIAFWCDGNYMVIDIPVIVSTTKIRRKKTGKISTKTRTSYDYPEIARLFRNIRGFMIQSGRDVICGLELGQIPGKKFRGMPFRQGTPSSAYQVGWASGMWPLILSYLRIRLEYMIPLQWKKAMGLAGKGKEAARELAKRRFPKATSSLMRVKDHNRAEALLLVDYLRKVVVK